MAKSTIDLMREKYGSLNKLSRYSDRDIVRLRMSNKIGSNTLYRAVCELKRRGLIKEGYDMYDRQGLIYPRVQDFNE